MKEILDFIADLQVNNNREWFAANKERYLKVKEQVEALAATLIAMVAELDPAAARLRVSDCTYRIYRDTRFSHDKTPYKNHIGIFVNPPKGKKGLTCGWYLHLEPGNCMVAAGTICHPTPVQRAIRQDIFDNIEEYREIVESPEFRRYFPTVGENPLKTAPKGFPKDWEWIDYLRPRDFVATCQLADADVCAPGFLEWLRPCFLQIARFNRFINYSIEPFDE